MKISIITIVFNDVLGIRKTIESVLQQTSPANEYIVIDGGSTDGTVSIIEEYGNRLTYFVSEPDSGIYNAMNKGWKQADEDSYILFCNSSDFLEINALYIYRKEFQLLTEPADIFHGLLRFIDGNGIRYIQGRSSDLLYTSMIEHPTCAVKKKIFNSVNGFSELYSSASDYDFMLNAKQVGAHFHFVEAIISNFDVSGISSTSSRGELESLKIKRLNGRLSFVDFLLRTSLIKIKSLVKGMAV